MSYTNSNNGDRNNRAVIDLIKSIQQTKYGTHSVVIYPDLDILREIYCQFVKVELDTNHIVLLLPYYETIEYVRNYLLESGLDLQHHLNEGSLLIIDSREAFFNHYNELPRDREKGSLVSLMRILRAQEKKLQKEGTTIIADLGCFFPEEGVCRLFEYEKSVPQSFSQANLKQICMYHQRDFDIRLTTEEKADLVDEHARSVIMVSNS